jgi:hypothetical protein
VAFHRQPQSARLDAAHPDRGATLSAPDHLRIRPQATIRNDRHQPVDMHDVIDLRLAGRLRHESGFVLLPGCVNIRVVGCFVRVDGRGVVEQIGLAGFVRQSRSRLAHVELAGDHVGNQAGGIFSDESLLPPTCVDGCAKGLQFIVQVTGDLVLFVTRWYQDLECLMSATLIRSNVDPMRICASWSAIALLRRK